MKDLKSPPHSPLYSPLFTSSLPPVKRRLPSRSKSIPTLLRHNASKAKFLRKVYLTTLILRHFRAWNSITESGQRVTVRADRASSTRLKAKADRLFRYFWLASVVAVAVVVIQSLECGRQGREVWPRQHTLSTGRLFQLLIVCGTDGYLCRSGPPPHWKENKGFVLPELSSFQRWSVEGPIV